MTASIQPEADDIVLEIGTGSGYQAAVLAEIVAEAPLMLKQGVAETVYPKEGQRPLSDLIAETFEAGVTISVCGAALELVGMTPDDLIEAVEDLVGPSFPITEGLKSDLVLTF